MWRSTDPPVVAGFLTAGLSDCGGHRGFRFSSAQVSRRCCQVAVALHFSYGRLFRWCLMRKHGIVTSLQALCPTQLAFSSFYSTYFCWCEGILRLHSNGFFGIAIDFMTDCVQSICPRIPTKRGMVAFRVCGPLLGGLISITELMAEEWKENESLHQALWNIF